MKLYEYKRSRSLTNSDHSRFNILAHLSRTEPSAHWRAYRIGRPPSSVCSLSVVCRPYSLNISSETVRPIEAKFHMESPWDGGRKVCSNGVVT